MRILVLGGDGYLGWPTAMYLSARGHAVGVVDNFAKPHWEMELDVEPLMPIHTLHDRVKAWHEVTGKRIELFVATCATTRWCFGPSRRLSRRP
jgi:UDP-sulfoquinovose synthase